LAEFERDLIRERTSAGLAAARVIDELMGHEPSTRGAQHLGSVMGAHYRHTTPEMAARVIAAIQARLSIVVTIAEEALEAQPTHLSHGVF
jgi:DNA invertase Pin-like site-specific DNA recombinase